MRFGVPDHAIPSLRKILSEAWLTHDGLGLRPTLANTTASFVRAVKGHFAATSKRWTIAALSKHQKFRDGGSGRSLRLFCSLSITPRTKPQREYRAVGRCIYCGDGVYSRRIGQRSVPLGGDYIVPEALGGNIELREASCQAHEDITDRLVAGDVLGRTLTALRAHLKQPGSGPFPTKLPLSGEVSGHQRTIMVPVEDYPIKFDMLAFGPPTVDGPGGTGRAVAGATAAVLRVDWKLLKEKHGVTSFAAAHWDAHSLHRFLAKIGHSFARAELKENFNPLLTELICDGNPARSGLIGGDPTFANLQKTEALHELGLGFQKFGKATYVVASIRLFAKFGGPQYYVIVGKSTESRLARARRVLSLKISRMLSG